MVPPDTAVEKIAGNKTSSALYQDLLRRLKGMGKFEVESKASSIHVVRGRAFLGIHYRKDALLLNVVLERALRGPRIKKSDQVSRNRYHNEILISSKDQFDRELIGWIEEAFHLTET